MSEPSTAPTWIPCPGCGLQYRAEQLLACARCGRGYCISCSRGVKLYDRFTGRLEHEGWLCRPCRDELGEGNYRPVF